MSVALTDAAEYLNLTTQSQIRRLHETQQKTRVMNESKEVLNLSNLKKNIRHSSYVQFRCTGSIKKVLTPKVKKYERKFLTNVPPPALLRSSKIRI